MKEAIDKVKKKKAGPPIGHPPYNIHGEGGRPVIYDEEFLNKEAEDFLDWMKLPTSIYFKRFAIDRGYSPQRFVEFAAMNSRFSEVYKYAKEWQECVLAQGAITKEFSEGFTKFVLVNHHNWADKTQQTISGDPQNPLGPFIAQVNGRSKDLVQNDSQSS